MSILYIFTVKSLILFNLSVPDPFISDLTILLNVSSQNNTRKEETGKTSVDNRVLNQISRWYHRVRDYYISQGESSTIASSREQFFFVYLTKHISV